MTYSSLLFIYIFLPVSLGIYCLAPKKIKDIVLLLESMVFCSFYGIKLLIFMGVYCVVNYTAALLIYSAKTKLKCIPFAFGILFDILMLLAFRVEYFSYIRDFMRIPTNIFPLGISLFTLSAIGCLVDVYNGNIKADKNFIRFSLFIMMFPRLIMGPVMSYDSFVLAMRRKRVILSEIGAGITVFVKGLAKKVLIADSLYTLCFDVWSTERRSLSVASAWLGAAAYLLCLYFTLSGFSDMGTGIGRCFGLKFPNSFNYPIFSGKIRAFSSKWHIQAIQWFRKYITRPLSQATENRLISKLIFICVWTLAGYWYGASAGAAVWGMLMGTAIVIENSSRKFKFIKSNGMIYTVPLIVIFSVFLACGDITNAWNYLWTMAGGSGILADSMTTYLIRSYIVVLLIAVYASTDLSKNMITRVKKSRYGFVLTVISPVVVLALLVICTAMMSYSGQSNTMIIRL